MLLVDFDFQINTFIINLQKKLMMQRMNLLIFSLFLCSLSSVYSQYKMDVNTIFACIPAEDYASLFSNSFVKDTLFVSKETTTKTDSDVYTGKYFIGEFGTIEFFQPSQKNKFGDHLGDIAIEFKTRNRNELNKILKDNKDNSLIAENTYDISTEDEKSLWYTALKNKTSTTNLELSILEYSSDYLQQLGFSNEEIDSEITPEKFNAIVYQNHLYPKLFKSFKSITIEVSQEGERELRQFAHQFQFKYSRKFINCNEFKIYYKVSKNAKQTQLKNIEINLTKSLLNRILTISENISLSISNTTANILFK